jgi:hypothetical protein
MIHEVFAQNRTSSVTAAPTSCFSASDFGSTTGAAPADWAPPASRAAPAAAIPSRSCFCGGGVSVMSLLVCRPGRRLVRSCVDFMLWREIVSAIATAAAAGLMGFSFDIGEAW